MHLLLAHSQGVDSEGDGRCEYFIFHGRGWSRLRSDPQACSLFACLQFTAAAISIIKKPWDIFFGANPDLLTPFVAFRLEGYIVPTTRQEVFALRSHLELEHSEFDWAPIENAWNLHEAELIAAHRECRHVSHAIPL